MSAPFDILVFSDDWGRHPSSCQHLIGELLPRYRVWWVNTIGTRRPALNWYTVRRGLGKLSEWMARSPAPPTGGPENPTVLAPTMWPSFRTSFGRRLNRRLLARAIRGAVDFSRPVVAVTTLPITADLIDTLPAARWVYYCVDDLSQWPGLDRESLESMERLLVSKVDRIVAVSGNLVERMASMGREATLLTHGVDLQRWKVEAATSPRFAAFEKPMIVFWGVVDRRLDTGWLAALSGRMQRGTIVLVGPDNLPDPVLGRLGRIVQTGPVAYEELPRIAAAAAVLVMPYADLPATRAMQPLKLKEYLATGRPVVTSALPAVLDWSDACDVAAAAEDFVRRVLERIETGTPADQVQARLRLREESWSQKARRFEEALRPQTHPSALVERARHDSKAFLDPSAKGTESSPRG